MSKEPDRYEIKHDPTKATVKASHPATPFMEGYKRPPVTEAKFFSALVKAMAAYPNLRVGQLIYDALMVESGISDPRNFHRVFFNIYDDELTKVLEVFTARKESK